MLIILRMFSLIRLVIWILLFCFMDLDSYTYY